MTNYEHIKHMSPDDLAVLLTCPNEMGGKDIHPCYHEEEGVDCHQCLLGWLQEEKKVS